MVTNCYNNNNNKWMLLILNLLRLVEHGTWGNAFPVWSLRVRSAGLIDCVNFPFVLQTSSALGRRPTAVEPSYWDYIYIPSKSPKCLNIQTLDLNNLFPRLKVAVSKELISIGRFINYIFEINFIRIGVIERELFCENLITRFLAD